MIFFMPLTRDSPYGIGKAPCSPGLFHAPPAKIAPMKRDPYFPLSVLGLMLGVLLPVLLLALWMVPEIFLQWPILLGVLIAMLLAFAVGGIWILRNKKRRSRKG